MWGMVLNNNASIRVNLLTTEELKALRSDMLQASKNMRQRILKEKQRKND